MATFNILVPLLLATLFCLFTHPAQAELRCSWNEDQKDPALREMTYDIGDGPQTLQVYVHPDVNSMYNGKPPASTKVVPKFEGFSLRFINLSNKRIQLHWISQNGTPYPMSVMLPFYSAGTSSFPGHEFIFTDPDDHSTIYDRTVVQAYPDNVKVYDPYQKDPDAISQLTPEELEQYQHLRRTLDFGKQYQAFTGRQYLADYLRDPPNRFIWPAEYLGQEHWVESYETHYNVMPAQSDLTPIQEQHSARRFRENDPRLLQDYRVPGEEKLNMTMKVLSVAPRVFEIRNFLSPVEVQHILEIGGAVELARSTVGNVKKDTVGSKTEELKSATRTSTNSWVERARSPIIDSIYRRAADLMRMDEALLRDRGDDELEHFENKKSIAEHLQLVHYNPGEEYVAHHDFGYRDLRTPGQKARFATLLLYLNHEGLEGGETSFPRWQNAETFHPLRVKPEAGKAVLFYSQLPDGNFDDFSQHAALKPLAGEKWLINLWTSAPYKDL